MNIILKNSDGHDVVICSADAVEQHIARYAEFGIELHVDVEALAILKNNAIKLIEATANEYHAQVIGTADKSREVRFALNLECAKRLLAGEASAAERQMLQVQLEANQAAQHPVLLGKSLEQFARWIVEFEQLTTLGAGLIEATLIKGRALVNAATSIEEIEQIKQQLAAQAQAAFEQLHAQVIPPHA